MAGQQDRHISHYLLRRTNAPQRGVSGLLSYTPSCHFQPRDLGMLGRPQGASTHSGLSPAADPASPSPGATQTHPPAWAASATSVPPAGTSRAVRTAPAYSGTWPGCPRARQLMSSPPPQHPGSLRASRVGRLGNEPTRQLVCEHSQVPRASISTRTQFVPWNHCPSSPSALALFPQMPTLQ